MADAYWRYSEARQQQQQAIPTLVGKRPRSDYDVPSGHELPNYYPRDDDRAALRAVRDSDSIEYPMIDTFVARCLPMSAYSGGQSARPISGVPSRPVDDSRVVVYWETDPGATVKDRTMGLEVATDHEPHCLLMLPVHCCRGLAI
ncbi:hypothetical protein GH714_031643 [Hevea brasiliensis]|uniref:Uncharacterized protein n=1 Tax=Hevea brasiliensis TaxID=3981 RepID=A0A6A6LGW8_HEVBR|nr:hypothetical protein GH714_031643 [Hevea brasiliensis]